MENAVDPYHVEALHGNYFAFIAEWKGFEMPSVVQEQARQGRLRPVRAGIIKRRQLVGQSEDDDDWAIGHPMVFPYKMWVGGNGVIQMQIRVPVDDTHTWMLFYTVHAPEGVEPRAEQLYPVDYEYEWIDENGTAPHRLHRGPGHHGLGDPGTDHRPDRGAPRPFGRRGDDAARMFKSEMAKVEAGEDPLGVIREKHERIDLPCEKNKFDAGPKFALDFIDMASQRFSPQADALKKLHIKAWENRGES